MNDILNYIDEHPFISFLTFIILSCLASFIVEFIKLIKKGCRYNKDITSLQLEIYNLKNNNEYKRLSNQAEALNNKIKLLENQLSENDRIIHDKDIEYRKLYTYYDHLRVSISRLKKQLHDKESECNELKHNLEKQNELKELFAYYLLVLDTDKKLINGIPELKEIYENMSIFLKGHNLANIDKFKEELQQNKKLTYPGAVELLSQFKERYDDIRIETLSARAYKSSELVKEMRNEKKELLTRCTMAESLLKCYEELFPWLEEFKTVDIDDAIEYAKGSFSNEDYEETLRKWLSPEEYSKMSNTEKLQLALDRYKKRNKTDWEAGIEYERYVGYLYEKDGYTVKYTGATDGLMDMGRDVLVSDGNETLVIQCKRWSKNKTIHEKHIFQIFGTAFVLTVQNPDKTYRPVFYTTTKLSDLAMACADQLGVIVYQEFPMGEYPLIKCNLGHDEFGNREKIYHLPFDQQYDRIKIESQKGEFYAMTIEEAESKGFRKAHRHYAS